MKEGVVKKGLSPVVASVFMILLVLVLASIVFLWSRGFIGEQIEKFGKPIEEYCDNVRFEVSKTGSELEVINHGSVDIRHLDIKMIKGGESENARFALQIDAGEAENDYVTLEVDGEDPDKIMIYPALIGNVKGASSRGVFTCIDSGVVL